MSLSFIDASDIELSTLYSVFDISVIRSNSPLATNDRLAQTPLQFARAKGHLLLTSEVIDPTLIRFDPATGDILFAKMTLGVRDVIGMESGIEVDKRPTVIGDFPVGETASGVYAALSENHEYNLYNQGWHQLRRLTGSGKVVSDPIAEFNTSNSEFPSNADIVYIGMVDSTGDLIFDAELLRDQTFGSSPSARGHYVLEAFDMNRDFHRLNKDESGAFTGGGGSLGGVDATWSSTFVGPLP